MTETIKQVAREQVLLYVPFLRQAIGCRCGLKHEARQDESGLPLFGKMLMTAFKQLLYKRDLEGWIPNEMRWPRRKIYVSEVTIDYVTTSGQPRRLGQLGVDLYSNRPDVTRDGPQHGPVSACGLDHEVGAAEI
ncbi:hypothetical protein [Stenotrophomonas maltophilia]|uniref:hypothetical protein n=1 Tax=Stenotrophomonas maltophilia TaxID=40324 RepID=UPI0011324289|nr:hypothetical protein [Stenotrophomonas maltophilia]